MFVLILQIAEAALSIWSSELKQKYIDQVAALKTQYYAEINKPIGQRDDSILDTLEFQLCLATSSLAASITGTKIASDIDPSTGV